MMRWLRSGFGLLLLSMSLANAQEAPFDPQRSVVLTDQYAYLALPPELIAAPTVRTLTTSSDGRYLLVARYSMRITQETLHPPMGREPQPPTGETSLVLWDSRTRLSREVWKADSMEGDLREMRWLSGTNVALALMRQTLPPDPMQPEKGRQVRSILLRITGSGERAQVVDLPLIEAEERTLHVSPSKPLALLQRDTVAGNGAGRQALQIIGEDGRLGAAIPLPEGFWLQRVTWGKDGAPFLNTTDPKPGQAGIQGAWFALDVRAGTLQRLDKAPDGVSNRVVPPTSPVPSLRVRLTQTTVKEEETAQPLGLLWLESAVKSEKPRILMSGDCSQGQLLPQNAAVVYTSQGAVFARPLLRLTKEEYLKMRQAAERIVVISNAKQLGLGLLMYSQDYDETLPSTDGVNDKIEPYLGSKDLFNDFNYTYGGGKLGDIKDPSMTELGYVKGQGGRAIIYADGHVVWKND